jgi:farnesyl-diphosphate farnesyltransferase
MTLDALLKSTARTLYLSAKALPKNIRKTFYCGYLICRAADSIADTDLVDTKKRIELIKDFPRLVQKQPKTLLAAYKKALPEETQKHEDERALLANLDLCLDEYKTLTPRHKKIVLEVVTSVCRAMEWDLSYFPSEDAELLKVVMSDEATISYCNDMGGEPGIFWAKLLLDGKKDEDFILKAKMIGRALQITNILRDINDDIKIGRCYLPLTDLADHNLMPQDLLEKKSYKKLRPVIYKWIDWGVDNLMAAPYFFNKIPRLRFGARASVAWPVLWSLDTFYMLAASDNLLNAEAKPKISKLNIYLTMLASPLYSFSSTIFRTLVNYKALKVKKLMADSGALYTPSYYKR